MARIEQYSYPISTATVFPFVDHKCRLGISISEQEFMELSSTPDQGFSFFIQTNTSVLPGGLDEKEIIHMGRTCMYQMDTYEKIKDFGIVSPSDKIVKTALIQVVYDQEREGEINE